MRNRFYILKSIIILHSLVLLSGCACLQSITSISAQRDQASLNRQCKQADVLITDLTNASANRSYVLPNGQVCPNKE